jgi:hypothetical protein
MSRRQVVLLLPALILVAAMGLKTSVTSSSKLFATTTGLNGLDPVIAPWNGPDPPPSPWNGPDPPPSPWR